MSHEIQLDVLDTGFCTARSSLIATGTGWRDVRCHAPAFLLRHPTRGALLFDTGYAPRIVDAFAQWPERIYRYATPTTLATPVAEQLVAFQLDAAEIAMVIVSHLHADHVAGLRDFPAARFVVARAALDLQRTAHGIGAVRRGILQALFPDDFERRAQVVEAFDGPAIPVIGATHDLFDDGSVLLVPLPGHARGQMGALVQTTRGAVLLCADGAWTSQAYRELRSPHWITGAMQDDMTALRSTLRLLFEFARARPKVAILPTHCPETLRWSTPS